MKVNIESCIKQAARVLRRKGDEGGYAYMLEEELLRHLKELRDAPAKHGEFFALYRFSDGKDPAPQAQEETRGAPAPAVDWWNPGHRLTETELAGALAVYNDVRRGRRGPDVSTVAALEQVIRDFLARQPHPPAPASPAALVWTKEKPKVDGWYCYRVFGERAWAVAEIRMFTGAPCWHSAERHAWVPITWDLEWAGPIPEPAAPEAGAPGTQHQEGK